ncbi:type II secretion system protein [Thalassotalea hakodatensis]|uniref:type II secretion system protein n=1 Tax=Thalassotalea hakodatensis TaxID=3030492 RepID=UPI002573F685|nr:type II secretion system protein [Thalassotalea hakodatensis]
MKKLSNVKGFTLIELVVVIVILGILAATAAPKFIDLTGDAKASVMQGVQGSINSAADLAHAKALVEGETSSSASISMAGETVNLAFGWPTNASIVDLIDIDESVSFAAGAFFHLESNDQANCRVTYNNNLTNINGRPEITAVDLDAC